MKSSGNFETDNSRLYIEDNWSVTDNLILNLGLRKEAFDNKDAAGRQLHQDGRHDRAALWILVGHEGRRPTKFFGNAGRYFLPVANVINIKQAGGLLDERTYYAFDGWEDH